MESLLYSRETYEKHHDVFVALYELLEGRGRQLHHVLSVLARQVCLVAWLGVLILERAGPEENLSRFWAEYEVIPFSSGGKANTPTLTPSKSRKTSE